MLGFIKNKKYLRLLICSLFSKTIRRFVKNIMRQSTVIPTGRPVLMQKCLFLGEGSVDFGDNVNIGYYPSPLFYSTYAHIEARNKKASVFIGSNTYINNNCAIIANNAQIKIGEGCRIGFNFQCLSSDFHGLTIDTRDSLDKVNDKDVVIGNDCFIGNNVTVLKGVTLGDGCVVGAGSVVTKSFEKDSVLSGNPAQFIRKIDNNRETLVGVEREREASL